MHMTAIFRMITIYRKYKKHVATHDNFDLFQFSIQHNVEKQINQKVRKYFFKTRQVSKMKTWDTLVSQVLHG